ncbi:MAG: hypothetical protein WKF92_09985 [Pyrinomonadaceae bacterium]
MRDQEMSDCDLIFPDPMPFPAGGLGQHYDVGADDYFKGHDPEGRLVGARILVNAGEELLGR